MPETAFRVFADWKLAFLASRDLNHTDRRPLHQYKLSDAEFADLEQLLRRWLGLLLVRTGLSNLPRLDGFSALFVLFAAEWWRRRFDGGHWSWDPILEAIGADPDSWNQAQRSECVHYGLRAWGLEPRSTGGLRFLGSIAVQGGLPLRLLAEDRGGIGHLLGQVLRQAGGVGVTQSDLLTWIESLHTMLPKSYRQAAIFALLADTAWAVLRLKEEGGLTPGVDAIALLDAKVPAWRDRFPLRVDDGHARGLIERLVKDAALVRTQRRVMPIVVERRIVPGEHSAWILQSIVTLPESIGADELAALFCETVEELPRFADLTLTNGADQATTSVRRMAGHDRYRIERAAWGHAGGAVAREYFLRLAAADGRAWSAHAPRGEAMDDELPWVFGDEDQSHRFLRQGGGSVGAMEALVAVPAGWTITPAGDSTLTECGELSGLGRRVFRVRGSVEMQDGTGAACRTRTGQAGAAEESIEWRGERVWLDFLSPTMAFKGRPQVYRVDEEGRALKLDGSIGWSVPDTRQAAGQNDYGPLSARYPSTGEIRHRGRLIALPNLAAFELIPRNATAGAIRLIRWGASAVRVVSERIDGAMQRADGELSLDVAMRTDERTPEQIEIEVFWPNTLVPARLRVPFPARGVRLFDVNGRERPSGATLCVQQLAGVRLFVLSESENARITLEIHGSGNQLPRTYALRSRSKAFGVETRLQDYATDLQHFLAFDGNPDARVRVVLRIAGIECFKLYVARYAAKIEFADPNLRLDAASFEAIKHEEAEALPVRAIRLERPGDEPVSLEPLNSQGVATGSWAFQPQTKEPGTWLIFPGPGATLPFRPTLWPVSGSVVMETPLASAIGLANRGEREVALDACLETMSDDFVDASWAEIERLIHLVGHLPLATLDLWRSFTRSSHAMAALAFRFSNWSVSFLERFAQELPFAWESVCFGSWGRAIAGLQRQLEATFGEDSGKAIFAAYLDSRLGDLSSLHPALAGLLGVASVPYKAEARQEALGLRYIGNVTALGELFEGPGCEMMKLRQRRANDQWPQGLHAILSRSPSKALIRDIGCKESHQFADSVINLPIALATDVASNQTTHWFENPEFIQTLRTHYAFDPEWFDTAYHLTIARCLGRGLLEF